MHGHDAEGRTMTAVTQKQTGPAQRPGPAEQAPAPPPKLRRRPWVAAAAVIALFVGAVGGLMTWLALSPSQEVVIAARDLDKYHVLDDGDLRTVSVALDPAVAAIPGRDAASLIGRRLTDGVSAGSVLAPAGVSDSGFPAPGLSVVRVTLTSQLAQGLTLAPGDQVRVVVSPPSVSADEEATFTPGEISAVHEGDAGAVVEVLVAHDQAVALSDAVVGGRASIVQDLAPSTGEDE
ncbi:SAF domain-containing protein [Myceligenerans crystallogenes]|uniref:SAF domain-containing protein n=1 Tax=Myceligenerans crystallogenes TaxID=316335 RepID=A0ABP4ZVS9_9MICO